MLTGSSLTSEAEPLVVFELLFERPPAAAQPLRRAHRVTRPALGEHVPVDVTLLRQLGREQTAGQDMGLQGIQACVWVRRNGFGGGGVCGGARWCRDPLSK